MIFCDIWDIFYFILCFLSINRKLRVWWQNRFYTTVHLVYANFPSDTWTGALCCILISDADVSICLLFFQDLKEECVKLRTRVFDLEQQNRILSLLFQQRVKMSSIPVSQVGECGTPDTERLWHTNPASGLFEFYMSCAACLNVPDLEKREKSSL